MHLYLVYDPPLGLYTTFLKAYGTILLWARFKGVLPLCALEGVWLVIVGVVSGWGLCVGVLCGLCGMSFVSGPWHPGHSDNSLGMSCISHSLHCIPFSFLFLMFCLKRFFACSLLEVLAVVFFFVGESVWLKPNRVLFLQSVGWLHGQLHAQAVSSGAIIGKSPDRSIIPSISHNAFNSANLIKVSFLSPSGDILNGVFRPCI